VDDTTVKIRQAQVKATVGENEAFMVKAGVDSTCPS